jgi:hypothetical protein
MVTSKGTSALGAMLGRGPGKMVLQYLNAAHSEVKWLVEWDGTAGSRTIKGRSSSIVFVPTVDVLSCWLFVRKVPMGAAEVASRAAKGHQPHRRS